MGTFDPRRLLMFAVKVLKSHNANRSNRSLIMHARQHSGAQRKKTRGREDARKAGVGIRNLLREKQALAGDRLGRIVIRHGESPRDAQAREGRERHGDLIAFQFRTCQLPPLGGEPLVNSLLPPLKRVGENHAATHRRRILNSTRTRSRTQPV